MLAAIILSWPSRSSNGAGDDLTIANVRLSATSSGLCFSADIISLREPEACGTKARYREVALVEGPKPTPFRAFAWFDNAWLRVKFRPQTMPHDAGHKNCVIFPQPYLSRRARSETARRNGSFRKDGDSFQTCRPSITAKFCHSRWSGPLSYLCQSVLH